MSDGELSRVEALRDLDQKRFTTEATARLLRPERCQFAPAIEALPDRGSNRLSLEATRSSQQPAQPGAATKAALVIVREWYWDFGPTLTAEKLREVMGLRSGRETLRLWMTEAGLWVSYPHHNSPPTFIRLWQNLDIRLA
jgi:hypothetical protein